MINYIKSDLFTTSDRIIMHGCNSAGVMGSGVAKIIKQKYPIAFADYSKQYNTSGGLQLGEVYFSEQPDGKVIVNAITQDIYGYNGQKYVSYDAIDMVMHKISLILKEPISMPKIGAGLGGGDWNVIKAIIEHRLKNNYVTIYSLN